MSFVDKLDVAASYVAGNDSETAVVKATRSDFDPPKEKHVRALILKTNDGAVPAADLVGALMLRLEKPQWNVVLKTLMLAHRLLRDGNLRFINELKFRPRAFALDRFADNETADGAHNSAFVRKYAQYLEEKVSVYKAIKVEFEKRPDACKGLSVDDMFVKLPKLQSLINALLNCRVQRADLNNSLVKYAFQYLLKDSYALYTCLSAGIINLIERYFEMSNAADAERAITIYKLFIKETDGIVSLYEMCRSFSGNVPDVNNAPTSLVEAMEEHLAELQGKPSKASGASGSMAKKEKKKKKKKAAQQQIADSIAHPGTDSSVDFFAVDWGQAAAAAPAPAAAASTAFDPFGGDAFAASPFGGGGATQAPQMSVASGAQQAAPQMSVSANARARAQTAPAPNHAASFDPFADHPSGGFGQQPFGGDQAAPPVDQDEKLRRIMQVQQQAAHMTGTLTSTQALTPEAAESKPLRPQRAQTTFNPFPQQPLHQNQGAQNVFSNNPFA